jgi:hypothetical protein
LPLFSLDEGRPSTATRWWRFFLQLPLPGTSQHRCPKWHVPGSSGAGTDVEWFSWKRWQRTWLRFVDLLNSSWCKFAELDCTFLFFLKLYVNYSSRWNMNAATGTFRSLSLFRKIL